MNKLNFSIPANNRKIIEFYNQWSRGDLVPNPTYQRKLVWRKQHKFLFIETILNNYPFPEVYLAPSSIDVDTLESKDEVVDGQQRLTTIFDYIKGQGVFAQPKIPIKKYGDLSKEEKEQFLKYEVSVRYLKDVSPEQVKEIFLRINATEYSLNKTEKLNAMWGASEFVCFAKQIVEEDSDLDFNFVSYKLETESRTKFLDFFLRRYAIFSENDFNRMLALQYILTLIATLCEGGYFRRNDKVQAMIEQYLDEFPLAAEMEMGLIKVVGFLESLNLGSNSYWFNKANVFTLIVELYRYDLGSIDAGQFAAKLNDVEAGYRNEIVPRLEGDGGISTDWQTYFQVAKEAVNEVQSREHRGKMIRELIKDCLL